MCHSFLKPTFRDIGNLMKKMCTVPFKALNDKLFLNSLGENKTTLKTFNSELQNLFGNNNNVDRPFKLDGFFYV